MPIMEKGWIYPKKIIISTALTVILLFFLQFRLPINLFMSVRHTYTSYYSQDLKKTKEFEWTPYMDFVEESIIMKESPLYDIKKAIDPTLTGVDLLRNSTTYSVGEDIRIRITLLDGYGHIRKSGGDQLRVRIFEERLGAYASGYVVDHYNGSNTAVVRALWRGNPTVEITIGGPREIARAWYHTMITTPGTRLYHAVYRLAVKQTSLSERIGLCHPFLRRITNISRHYCNRTRENDGSSLYCVRPQAVSCQDFESYSVQWRNISKTFTKAEQAVLSRYNSVLKAFKIKVNGPIPLYISDHGIPNCSSFDSAKLWMLPSPVGFFFQSNWRTIHCKMLSNHAIEKCLKNKHFILLGDSTVRQWFEYIQRTYECDIKTNNASYKQCVSKKFNFSIDFSFPAIPGHYMVEETTFNSIPSMITKFSNRTGCITVFHQQLHPSSNHPDVFRDRMISIRKSIQKILKFNRHVRFYFKGPHTCRGHQPYFGDYFGFVYRTIALEVFDGLFDNIVYLDSKDMTVSTKQIGCHPDLIVVKAMVEQFLSYVC